MTGADTPPSSSERLPPPYGRLPRLRDARRSIELDLAFARIAALPWPTRIRFFAQKIMAGAAIARGKTFELRLGPRYTFTVATLADFGTLQANIVDVYSDLVLTGILSRVSNIVDVGANLGQWAFAVKLFKPHATITCLEPEPTVFTRLEAHMRQFTGVRCLCCAAGAGRMSAKLYRHSLSVMSSLHPAGAGYDAADTVMVDVDAVDYLVGADDVDLLKIDVEGAELEVLRGALNILRRSRFLLVELSLDRASAGAALETLEFVKSSVPDARMVKVGRIAGPPTRPTSQDAIIDLRPVTA